MRAAFSWRVIQVYVAYSPQLPPRLLSSFQYSPFHRSALVSFDIEVELLAIGFDAVEVEHVLDPAVELLLVARFFSLELKGGAKVQVL